jgi:hypothetical protein
MPGKNARTDWEVAAPHSLAGHHPKQGPYIIRSGSQPKKELEHFDGHLSAIENWLGV